MVESKTDQQSKIKELAPEVVNQIAAGEVIPRPASVVKELVENAIDAGATQIFISIENSGRDLIEVRDNGGGMTLEDLNQSVKRHATSKISDFNDIFSVKSLGFRGEAIPSIASVSNMEILSRTRTFDGGIRVTVKNETITDSKPEGMPVGTIVKVKDLFFNTPVRRKFLKSDRTELSLITDPVSRLALIYPDIEFSLIHNDKKIFSCARTGSLIERISAVLGRNFARHSTEILHEDEELFIRGFISTPEVSKGNPSGIYTFLNGRFIKDRAINHAILSAYSTLLMTGRFPYAVVIISIDPTLVDVNVHPSKSEVKFANPRKIYDLVNGLIKRKLSTGFWLDPDNLSNIGAERSSDPIPEITGKELPSLHPYTQGSSSLPTSPGYHATGREKQLNIPEESLFFSSLRIIGQFSGIYIVCEKDDRLYLIDHHAAHERIQFEKLKHEFQTQKIESQTLLVPLVLDLDSAKTAILKKLAPAFLETGIEFEDFGENTFVVKRVPALLPEASISDLIDDLIDRVIEEHFMAPSETVVKSAFTPLMDDILSLIACHSAIRGQKRLTPEEMKNLLVQLDESAIGTNCPHGRPILIDFSREEVERRFGRQR